MVVTVTIDAWRVTSVGAALQAPIEDFGLLLDGSRAGREAVSPFFLQA